MDYQSRAKLNTCHPFLQQIVSAVDEHRQLFVICGQRGKADQDLAVAEGKSKTPWPKSTHNTTPSTGIDLAFWHSTTPHIQWNNRDDFLILAGMMFQAAGELGHPIRWGGDWNRNLTAGEKGEWDLVHFELVGVEAPVSDV